MDTQIDLLVRFGGLVSDAVWDSSENPGDTDLELLSMLDDVCGDLYLFLSGPTTKVSRHDFTRQIFTQLALPYPK